MKPIKGLYLKIVFHLVMIVGSAVTLLPFLWMLTTSFSPSGASSIFPPQFVPRKFSLEHYITIFQRLNLGRYFINSMILSVSVTLVSLLVNAMAGFAFAKYAFPGKKQVFQILLLTMIIPGQVTILPVFLLLNKMGLLNSYFGIIIPGMASIFGIFMIRQYLTSIPDSLIEAARIDGASDFFIFRKIILPLARPVLITLGMFTFMGTWNDFLWPLIVMTREDKYTLPVALANLMGEHAQDTELIMAGAVIAVLPVIILFLALQKYYMRGLLMGGIKE